MEYTKRESEEIKTLDDAWQVLKEHGLEGAYCPHCDQFSQARALLKQDKIISDLYEALKALVINEQECGIPEGQSIIQARQALAKVERKPRA